MTSLKYWEQEIQSDKEENLLTYLCARKMKLSFNINYISRKNKYKLTISVLKHWILGGWFPRGLIVYQLYPICWHSFEVHVNVFSYFLWSTIFKRPVCPLYIYRLFCQVRSINPVFKITTIGPLMNIRLENNRTK
jgi:hypothetical protein